MPKDYPNAIPAPRKRFLTPFLALDVVLGEIDGCAGRVARLDVVAHRIAEHRGGGQRVKHRWQRRQVAPNNIDDVGFFIFDLEPGRDVEFEPDRHVRLGRVTHDHNVTRRRQLQRQRHPVGWLLPRRQSPGGILNPYQLDLPPGTTIRFNLSQRSPAAAQYGTKNSKQPPQCGRQPSSVTDATAAWVGQKIVAILEHVGHDPNE